MRDRLGTAACGVFEPSSKRQLTVRNVRNNRSRMPQRPWPSDRINRIHRISGGHKFQSGRPDGLTAEALRTRRGNGQSSKFQIASSKEVPSAKLQEGRNTPRTPMESGQAPIQIGTADKHLPWIGTGRDKDAGRRELAPMKGGWEI
jgi:hypothetical protein